MTHDDKSITFVLFGHSTFILNHKVNILTSYFIKRHFKNQKLITGVCQIAPDLHQSGRCAVCQSCVAHLASDALAQMCWSYRAHCRLKQGVGGTAGGAWDVTAGTTHATTCPSPHCMCTRGCSLLVPKATARNLHRDVPSTAHLLIAARHLFSQQRTNRPPKTRCAPYFLCGLGKCRTWRWPEDNFSAILDSLDFYWCMIRTALISGNRS